MTDAKLIPVDRINSQIAGDPSVGRSRSRARGAINFGALAVLSLDLEEGKGLRKPCAVSKARRPTAPTCSKRSSSEYVAARGSPIVLFSSHALAASTSRYWFGHLSRRSAVADRTICSALLGFPNSAHLKMRSFQ